MEQTLIRKLIEEDIIDFNKLILKNYRLIGLTEIEAFVVIELHQQMRQGNTFLNPTKIAKNVTISKDELLEILDNLIKRQYLTIRLKKTKSGKETEIFHMDETIAKIISSYHKSMRDDIINQPKQYATNAEEIVDLIETQFQKQLTPLEIEIIQKWLDEDKFDILEIKNALLDAIKANKFSLSYVDGILVKRKAKSKNENKVNYDPGKSEALKNFFDSWDEK
ncbi:MAG: DnaD domain protein [Bacilli bacterium]|nr:DnaD domain protein [Bacilli bacterium]MBN2697118.1 DnaD domain protein [Bacilli bacterium]